MAQGQMLVEVSQSVPHGAAATVRIVLPGAGTACRIRVLGREEQPVHGARITVGAEYPVGGVPLGTGALGLSPPALQVRTDVNGLAELDGLGLASP